MRANAAFVLTAITLLAACDGEREKAGEKADAAMNVDGGLMHDGPQERLGEIRDREARDQAKAVEAQADATEHRADEIEAAADQKADALERQAKEVREQAERRSDALDQQADAIRGK
ncbi:hypothetical protein [Sphingomonas xinjiangensis]|uniref:Uncharacterized protein n=1 Tax=Sphingomonas xinjiangensis TaxID=643568 RepID=A0A840YTT9_9SPHN|nr:hypothetical protein [Sphingomonas xinjiangensis]MBB5713033.1 hypothetical protein [Sphingomonas xinjiangensis]